MPQRLYDLIGEYFEKAGSTLDVGCGIGRDTNWLIEQGYGYAFEIWVVGIDKKAGGLNWLTGFFLLSIFLVYYFSVERDVIWSNQ